MTSEGNLGADTSTRRAILTSFVLYAAPLTLHDFPMRCWALTLVSSGLHDSFDVSVRLAYIAWTVLMQGIFVLALKPFFRWAPQPIIPTLVASGLLFFTVGIPLSIGAIWLDSRAVPFLYREREAPALDWVEGCRVENAYLLAPKDSRFAALEQSGRAWLVDRKSGEPRLLLAEGCKTVPFGLKVTDENELARLFEIDRFELRGFYGLRSSLFGNQPSYWGKTHWDEHGLQFTRESLLFRRQYAPGGCALYKFAPTGIINLPGDHCPILSDDSASVAWLDGASYSRTERLVELSSTTGNGARSIDISKVGEGFSAIEDVSTESQSLLVRRRSSNVIEVAEYSEVGFDGKVSWMLSRRGDPDDGRLIRHGANWVWWQSQIPRDAACCAIEWHVNGRGRTQRVARGRQIVSVSLHPSGRYIAVSVTDRHSTGRVEDAVYVVRAQDGVEVFRRYLPAFTRSRVQFLGDGLLAYTEFDGATRTAVRLVRTKN